MINLIDAGKRLSTPFIAIDWQKCLANIKDMQDFSDDHNLQLRPHIKAHKLPKIALEQIKAGARGVTASKLGEVEVMLAAGIKDILLAYPVIGDDKIAKFIELSQLGKLSTIVDSLDSAKLLAEAASKQKTFIDVYIKIDSGLHRLGVAPGPGAIELAKEVVKLPGLQLQGILTHAGHVYGAADRDTVERIGHLEGSLMVKCAEQMRQAGLNILVVSIGSTPTAKLGGKVSGVTEIRPGNYVFNDAIQVGLGVVSPEQCSLRVIATVIGHPAPNRVIIDAGSKVFALDKGAHGTSVVNGFGIIIDHPKATLARLSEEHGIIEWPTDEPIALGQRLEIIPNHACTVVNLTDEVQIWHGADNFETVPVAARGKVR